MRLEVKVIPKAGRDEVAGWLGDALKVRVTAAPEGGKANEAVLCLLAETLGLPRARLRLVAGQTQPRKLIEIDGITDAALRAAVGAPSGRV